jgi:hypothetical protein
VIEVTNEAVLLVILGDDANRSLTPNLLSLVQEDTSVQILLKEETVAADVGVLGEVGGAEMESLQISERDLKPTVTGIFVEGEVMHIVEVHRDKYGVVLSKVKTVSSVRSAS